MHHFQGAVDLAGGSHQSGGSHSLVSNTQHEADGFVISQESCDVSLETCVSYHKNPGQIAVLSNQFSATNHSSLSHVLVFNRLLGLLIVQPSLLNNPFTHAAS